MLLVRIILAIIAICASIRIVKTKPKKHKAVQIINLKYIS